MNNKVRFIVVDDDPVNNMICKAIILNGCKDAEIVIFELPEQGLKYIEDEYSEMGKGISTVLLLDVNMPIISGWQFLEHFHNLNSIVKGMITIYILSSSISDLDIEQADANPYVKRYIEKPFSSQKLKSILDDV